MTVGWLGKAIKSIFTLSLPPHQKKEEDHSICLDKVSQKIVRILSWYGAHCKINSQNPTHPSVWILASLCEEACCTSSKTQKKIEPKISLIHLSCATRKLLAMKIDSRMGYLNLLFMFGSINFIWVMIFAIAYSHNLLTWHTCSD